jgi:hypothetical protein
MTTAAVAKEQQREEHGCARRRDSHASKYRDAPELQIAFKDCICADAESALWLGSLGQGVLRMAKARYLILETGLFVYGGSRIRTSLAVRTPST